MAKIWHIKQGKSLNIGQKSLLMGIVNVTPDSFSDGGKSYSVENAVAQAQAMKAAGADIIDIGGESTHPNAAAVSAEEEQNRILPVIKALKAIHFSLPLSVDTYRSQTAAAALSAGAHIVNDVCGLQKDALMAKIIAGTGAGAVITHNGRGREKHKNPLIDQRIFLTRSLEIAAKAGIKLSQIVLDPGFGFAKTPEESFTLLRHAKMLQQFALPLLAGVSRKGFLKNTRAEDTPEQRDIAAAAGSVILRMQGFSLFRVHNIAVNRQALDIADKVCAVSEAD